MRVNICFVHRLFTRSKTVIGCSNLSCKNFYPTCREWIYPFRLMQKQLNRLRDYKHNYLLFIKNYDAPFTNNLAERDLRPCKTKQKVSGCFRSWEGLSNFAKIRSLISTAKKRSLNLLVSISQLFFPIFPTPAEL